MTKDRLRLLYLSRVFPPGVNNRFPSLRACASHTVETRMAEAMARQAQISTVSILPAIIWNKLEPRDNSPGLELELALWDRKPELWHRWVSWRKLRQYYIEKTRREGMPDALLVYNFQAPYNRFIQWLRQQPSRPLIILVLADSGLGEPVPFSRRFRYWFKPMQVLEDEAVLWFDACLGFGVDTQRHFVPRGVPWLWMPSAYKFYYEPPAAPVTDGPIQFGYFGGLSEHIGALAMIRGFLKAGVSGSLRVCGSGKIINTLQQLAAQHANFHYDGLLTQPECLEWAQKVDILINPRPSASGLENSFPSKLFEYAMTGKAILSTRTGGVDRVLGEEGFYLDTENLEDSVCRNVSELAVTNRVELQRRGNLIRHRVINDFNWDAQARRIIEFVQGILDAPPAKQAAIR